MLGRFHSVVKMGEVLSLHCKDRISVQLQIFYETLVDKIGLCTLLMGNVKQFCFEQIKRKLHLKFPFRIIVAFRCCWNDGTVEVRHEKTFGMTLTF